MKDKGSVTLWVVTCWSWTAWCAGWRCGVVRREWRWHGYGGCVGRVGLPHEGGRGGPARGVGGRVRRGGLLVVGWVVARGGEARAQRGICWVGSSGALVRGPTLCTVIKQEGQRKLRAAPTRKVVEAVPPYSSKGNGQAQEPLASREGWWKKEEWQRTKRYRQ